MVPPEKFLDWNTELIKSEIEKLSASPFSYKGGTLVKSFVFLLFLAFSFQIHPRLLSIKKWLSTIRVIGAALNTLKHFKVVTPD